jgi:GDP-L-fucose synthase
MDKNSKIYVAGHRGLVGSAIVRALQAAGYTNIVTATRQRVDLLNQQAVTDYFAQEKPEYVFLAAAKVGGILANSTYPADFIYENLMIEANLIHESWRYGVKKLLLLGSSCIYPQMAKQPIKEEALLTGPLEPSNDAYALAKIAGIKMCQAYNAQYGTNYISVMPTNLYGPNDNFDLASSHVLPALIRKFHEAKQEQAPAVTVWGTGTPVREFLYVDDLADACLYLMNQYHDSKIVNIGTGIVVTIKELALLIGETVGYTGEIVFDTSKPDGTPVKINDVSYLKQLGWTANVDLVHGLKQTYAWFLLIGERRGCHNNCLHDMKGAVK